MNSTVFTPENLFPCAVDFLQRHQDEHLIGQQEHLISRCVEHLVATAEVSAETAHIVAMQALGDIGSRRRRHYIDLSRSTSFALFLVDGQGKRHAYTIADLAARLGLQT